MSNIIETKKSETILFNADGVKLCVRIDYDEGTVSFIGGTNNKYNKDYQKFIFADRTIDYLGGWVKVFEALKEITLIADARLREHKDTASGRAGQNLLGKAEAIYGGDK